MSGKAHLQALEQQEQQRRLSKAELLEPKIVEEDYYLEKLGGTVRVRSLSGSLRSKIRHESGFQTPQFDADKMEFLTILYSVIDPELTVEDLEALQGQDVGILDELSIKVTMLNMLGQTDDVKKDSSPTENSDSP